MKIKQINIFGGVDIMDETETTETMAKTDKEIINQARELITMAEKFCLDLKEIDETIADPVEYQKQVKQLIKNG